jgi:hypothetical protein
MERIDGMLEVINAHDKKMHTIRTGSGSQKVCDRTKLLRNFIKKHDPRLADRFVERVQAACTLICLRKRVDPFISENRALSLTNNSKSDALNVIRMLCGMAGDDTIYGKHFDIRIQVEEEWIGVSFTFHRSFNIYVEISPTSEPTEIPWDGDDDAWLKGLSELGLGVRQ